jgi:GxxExxY protein
MGRGETLMNADLKHKDLTDAVLCCFYTVYNSLGYGFLEKVYENALLHEFAKRGIAAVSQSSIIVYYDGKAVGEYFADLVIENSVIVEIKAARNILSEHEAQLLNYLKATDIEVGLLLNFGPKAEFRRKVFENERKH